MSFGCGQLKNSIETQVNEIKSQIEKEVYPHFLRGRMENHFGKKNYPQYTRLRFELNLPVTDNLVYCESSALDPAAPEAVCTEMRYSFLHSDSFIGRRQHQRVEDYFGKHTLITPDQYSNLDLPVINSLVYCESSALGHVATEAAGPCRGDSRSVLDASALGVDGEKRVLDCRGDVVDVGIIEGAHVVSATRQILRAITAPCAGGLQYVPRTITCSLVLTVSTSRLSFRTTVRAPTRSSKEHKHTKPSPGCLTGRLMTTDRPLYYPCELWVSVTSLTVESHDLGEGLRHYDFQPPHFSEVPHRPHVFIQVPRGEPLVRCVEERKQMSFLKSKRKKPLDRDSNPNISIIIISLVFCKGDALYQEYPTCGPRCIYLYNISDPGPLLPGRITSCGIMGTRLKDHYCVLRGLTEVLQQPCYVQGFGDVTPISVVENSCEARHSEHAYQLGGGLTELVQSQEPEVLVVESDVIRHLLLHSPDNGQHPRLILFRPVYCKTGSNVPTIKEFVI
uniref:Uncharacterized protein n=1 Tax=Timema cristinae TaxID=61476 RepID=A0A7R9CZP4_TIMCR|nr:unnamed protein product [Timema cristinae]